MNKKQVYTCETCSALFLCLKYFQQHRKKHAQQENKQIYPCNYCQNVHESQHESKLHSQSHIGELPHSCEVCQEMLSISEVEVLGTRRSIGTATDNHVFNVALAPQTNVDEEDDNNHVGLDHEDEDEVDNDDDDNEDSENEDSENDDDDDDDDDEDDEDDDEDDDEEDEDEDEEDEENELININNSTNSNNNNTSNNNNNNNNNNQSKDLAVCKPNVNIIYVTNHTINHTTTPKPSRPSRSTGKGKGNRKARLTTDGDIRRKFSCCHCGKSFKTKSHLQRHILTHTGEKPYHCNRCDCRFNQSSSLRNHVIAIHTKEYPHTCNNCQKGFLMPAVLQKHLLTSECGKITNQVVEGL